MSMSKQDFIALADAVNALTASKGISLSRLDVINMLAQFCEQQNHAFNRSRWIAYVNGECGPNGGRKG